MDAQRRGINNAREGWLAAGAQFAGQNSGALRLKTDLPIKDTRLSNGIEVILPPFTSSRPFHVYLRKTQVHFKTNDLHRFVKCQLVDDIVSELLDC